MSRRELLDLKQLELAAPLIRIAAHPIRLRIIDLLSRGEACVGDIAAAAETPQAIASQHLATLRQAGVLSSTRDGQRVYYRLVRSELVKLLDCIRDHCQLKQAE
jgi:ArsR family transcriptional regulator